MELKEKIKKTMENLISNNDIGNAKKLLNEYAKIGLSDPDYYGFKGTIHFIESEIKLAIEQFKLGLIFDNQNFDLNYNLALSYETELMYSKAYWHYSIIINNALKYNLEQEINEKVYNLKSYYDDSMHYDTKIAFFVKPGMDSFLSDIVMEFDKIYTSVLFEVNDLSQIDEVVKWSDISWFEWCDELIIYGSHLQIAKDKKIICRLHSYEAFTEYISNVNWNNIDKLIFISENIRKYVLEIIDLHINKTVVIPNGIDIKKWTYKERKHGFNIAYVGYINYKKGPMLLLHAFKSIYDSDKRYKLYIAGEFQDPRDLLYFEQMIKEFGLEKNFFFEGWQNDLDNWLEDKNYIICTSVLESQNMSVMQAMAKGIKPLVHNFVGARNIYSQEFLWNTIEEGIKHIQEKEYNSEKYKRFIVNKFSKIKALQSIQKVFSDLSKERISYKLNENTSLVTVSIFSYNYSHYIDEAIASVLNQTYKNIEIVVIDDCSQDDSISKIKNYEKNNCNIRGIYHTENSGNIVKGLKEIIATAKGQYVLFLSADDFIKDQFVIEELVEYFTLEPGLDYVYGNLDIVDSEGEYKDKWTYSKFTNEQVIRETFNRMGSGIMPVTIGMYNIDFYKRNGITWYHEDRNKLSGDVLNSLVNIKYGWKYKYVNRSYMSYRHHNNNMTYNLKDRIPSLISVIEFIIENFDEAIYMPEIDFPEIVNLKIKNAYKMYKIAEYYFQMLLYYKNGFKPWESSSVSYSDDSIKEWVEVPLIKMVEQYLQKSINIGNYLEEDIIALRKKIYNYSGKED